MKFYLVQHGDALAEAVDAARPLSEKGERDVRALAEVLARAKAPVRIVHSGKLRARQTAEIIAARVAPGRAVEAWSGLDPKSDPADVARSIAQATVDLVVVSHMPFVGRLASLLVAGDAERDVIAFQPGTAACLERDNAGSWAISWVLHPGLMP